jgi:hypothetical protein
MIARRLTVAALVSSCALVCVFTAGAAPAMAVTRFGEEGTGAGQVRGAYGLAVDQASGDLYVADQRNVRIDKFDGSGNFLFAWGWGVADSAEEPQTCTTSCEPGIPGAGSGTYAEEGSRGVAVDNDPLSASYGDVYVVDWENFRVEKFDSSGQFLSMFGGGVNKTTSGDVCVAGESCGAGTEGAADGQFEWSYQGSYIAVGPGGRVYVGDRARIEVFEPSGAWREDVSLSALSSTGQVTELAVDSAGDMFVKDSEAAGVRVFEPNGAERPTQLDPGSETVEALAIDASGDLFVSDSTGGFHVAEYDSSGKEVASFGSDALVSVYSMAFSSTLDELYAYGFIDSEGDLAISVITPPPPGPLLVSSGVATPGERGHASLEATVNPEGHQTTYRFEYVDEAHFQTGGYASASSTSPVSVGSSFEGQPASVDLTGLVPGGTYHYRIVATSSAGTATGPDQTFTTVGPALVDGPWVTDLAATSATLAAEIDPLGTSTEYQLEYGTSASYGQTLSGSVGEGTSYVPIGFHSQELLPGTVYHYRLVTHNEVGTVEGTDHTFKTQLASGEELALPDGRAWELVSPVNKQAALIEPYTNYHGPIQAASDGHGITYSATQPIGSTPAGRDPLSQVMSVRGAGGWTSADIDIQHNVPAEGENAGKLLGDPPAYPLFSPDLSLAIVEPPEVPESLSPEASERTIYEYDEASGTYLPLVTKANVPPGTRISGNGAQHELMSFTTATPDMSHVLFVSEGSLTSGAIRAAGNLYEWSDGQLQLVNVGPDGKQTNECKTGGVAFGRELEKSAVVDHAISDDGRLVVWTCGSIKHAVSHELYLRDTVAGTTAQIGGRQAMFETMSSDGSMVFFLEHGELYEFDTRTGTQTDLTADHGPGEQDSGVQQSLLGRSEDGSYVYFVAHGVLASGGVSGADNLYVAHDSESGWKTTYIATLGVEDEKSWFESGAVENQIVPQQEFVTSRVSPNGHYVTFMSNRSLTGYDNLDAKSGQPDEEVYLYDAISGRLICASCDPTGARPVGVLDKATQPRARLLVDGNLSWGYHSRSGSHWLAGNIPGWRETNSIYTKLALYQPRDLSDEGRLFFQSPDALVAQDTNGLEDVYEYDPVGLDCDTTSPEYSEHSGGCVGLISSGTSSGESAFLDASESGDDVFFVTASKLVAADYDDSLDVYDARVCTALAPCPAAQVSPPPCTSGDSCKAAPSPQPEIFGPAPSATFSGTGNVPASSSKAVVRPKASTRTQKLLRALAICHKKRDRAKRASCERQARKRYPAERSRKANTAKKGDR